MTKAINAWVKRNQNHFKDSNEKNHLIDFLTHEYSLKNSINFSYSQCVSKADAWVTKLNQKNLSQIDLGRVDTFFEEGPYKIVKILDQVARNYEGAKMGHCVAKYKDEAALYSLRDKENIPHCTIEIRDGKVNQISGRANSSVSPKYIGFLISFFQKINIAIPKDILKLMGYVHNPEALMLIKKLSSNVKIKVFYNHEYIYTRNKLKFISPLLDQTDESIYCLMSYLCETSQNQEELINLASKHPDLLLKTSFFQDCNDYTIGRRSPIHISFINQSFDFTKRLIKNHVKDYHSLFACPALFNQTLALKDEDFIRYLFSIGFRLDGGHDPGYELRSSGYYEWMHCSVFIFIMFSKDLSMLKDFEQAGFNPLLVPIKYIWFICTCSRIKNDQAKRGYISSLKIPLTDYAVAAIEVLNKSDPAAVDLFLGCFGVTLDEAKLRVTPELVESHIKGLNWALVGR